jgi:hypothetical protein
LTALAVTDRPASVALLPVTVLDRDDRRPPKLSRFAAELVERGRRYERGSPLVLREEQVETRDHDVWRAAPAPIERGMPRGDDARWETRQPVPPRDPGVGPVRHSAPFFGPMSVR